MSKRQCVGPTMTGSMWDSLNDCEREQYDTFVLTPLTHHLLKALVECVWQYYEDEWVWDQCPIEMRETVTQEPLALLNPRDVKAFQISITNFSDHGTYMQPTGVYYPTPRVQLRLSTKRPFKSGLELWSLFSDPKQKEYDRIFKSIHDFIVTNQLDVREFVKVVNWVKTIVVFESRLLVFKRRTLLHTITPPRCVFCSGSFLFLDIVPIKRDVLAKHSDFIVSLRCDHQVAIKHLVV